MFRVTNPVQMNATLRIGFFLLFALLVTLLSACSDTAVTKEGACVDTADGGAFCLKIVNSAGEIVRNIDRNSNVSVIAISRDSNDNGQQGLVVTFDTDLGQFSNEGTSLTDSSGEARIELSTGSESKAGNATASIDINGEALSVSYGFAIGGVGLISDDAAVTTDPAAGTTDPSVITETEDTNGGAVSTSVTGAIEFISTSMANITLRGTGGAGLSEFSTVTFRVLGSDGLPMRNKKVNFSLNTYIGGLDLDPASDSTDAEGLVSTTVQSGTIPTSVRVTASTQMTDIDGGVQVVNTVSDNLVASTGIPDQNSMTLALSAINVEAADYIGETVDVTVHLADHFNNNVPDGTTVYFTSEGGAIESSCETEKGACTVIWKSQYPYPEDHRVTILATTLGNESFQDTDSDGKYTLADGEPFVDGNKNEIFDEAFTDENSNGVFDEPFADVANGKFDLTDKFLTADEPYTDANANSKWDAGEDFTDTNEDGVYSLSDDINNDVYDPKTNDTFTDIGDSKYTEGEDFTDSNGNGFWDSGELYVDVNNNGSYDVPETYSDTNANGVYDIAEPYTDSNANGIFDAEPFVDANSNKIFDVGEAYTDVNLNGQYDIEPFEDNNLNLVHDPAEPFTDVNGNGLFDIGDTYTDANGNGQWDNVPEPYVDRGNGLWDTKESFTSVPDGVYTPGESYIDLPNGLYDEGEYFTDYNGNGKYDGDGDNPSGEVLYTDSNNGNGFYDGSGRVVVGEVHTNVTLNLDDTGLELNFFDGPGFADLAEPFLDANENGKRDIDEIFVDTNNNGIFDAVGDTKYNGILCVTDNNCSDLSTLHIRKSRTLITSSSSAFIRLYDANESLVYGNNAKVSLPTGSVNISGGRSKSFELHITDTAGQVIPAKSVVSITSSVGELSGSLTTTIAQTSGVNYSALREITGNGEIARESGHYIYFSIADTSEDIESGNITIKVTTPKGNETTLVVGISS